MFGIKEETIEKEVETQVQVKTRKYSATPIKGIASKGNFTLSMARKTCVDVSVDHLPEEENDSCQKIRTGKACGGEVCFTCCSQV